VLNHLRSQADAFAGFEYTIRHTYSDSAGLATDGIYGPATRDATLSWQRREHLEVDGIVGPQTRSSLGLPG
jgi:peptidoglycan hydrolase-like protein with peptidoglycan-binding domain